ncbi:MAG: hypothetical protein DMF00_03870 [Verrucomicrobia bacterium]|nr:MAG: hypothetical protein DMF00_03870 [Verrucomicrobiota bacterium]
MKKTFVLLGVVACLAACESINYVPPATPQMAGATKGRPVDVALLQKGRTLLAHRDRDAIVAYIIAVRSQK